MSAPDGHDGRIRPRQKTPVFVAYADVNPDVPSLLDTRKKAVAKKPPLDVDSDVPSILNPAGDLLEVLRKEVQLFDAQVSPSVSRTLEGSRLQCPFRP